MAIDRRHLILSGIAAGVAGPALAQQTYMQPPGGSAEPMPQPPPNQPVYPAKADTYSKDELVSTVSDFFGVTTEAIGSTTHGPRTSSSSVTASWRSASSIS